MSHSTISSFKKIPIPANQEVTTSQKPAKECDNKSANKPTEQKKAINSKKPINSNICFLCGSEGHYGSQTSCYASKHVRKNYFN